MADDVIRAAGVVLIKRSSGQPKVLLVHRPNHDDWSLPKGKLDKGEGTVEAALRECAEETGITPVLGPPLERQKYRVMGRPKVVDYWSATPGKDRGFRPDDEIDDIMWATYNQAKAVLSYPRDRQLVHHALDLGETTPLVILRHTAAVRRGDHKGRDKRRPLTGRGRADAKALIPILSAFGISEVHSSDATRCAQTVHPFAAAIKTEAHIDPVFSEEHFAKRPNAAIARITKLAADPTPVLVCSHRPVLPGLVGVFTSDLDKRTAKAISEPLRVGGMVIVHRSMSKGKWRVVAIERYHND